MCGEGIVHKIGIIEYLHCALALQPVAAPDLLCHHFEHQYSWCHCTAAGCCSTCYDLQICQIDFNNNKREREREGIEKTCSLRLCIFSDIITAILHITFVKKKKRKNKQKWISESDIEKKQTNKTKWTNIWIVKYSDPGLYTTDKSPSHTTGTTWL